MSLDLNAIRERTDKATPGPWRAVDLRHQRNGQIRIFSDAKGEHDILANVLAKSARPDADAEFIEHAREDVDALLAALAAVEQDRDRLSAELARVTTMRKELLARGYRDIAEHKGLHVGARIRHRGQQWTEALAHGTGFVAVLTEKPDSAWSRTYHMPDIELVAAWDKPWPLDTSRLSGLAQYHVEVIQTGEG